MVKNILLLTVDSLRIDEYNRQKDSLKTDSGVTEFAKAFATGPGTTPSFPALLTGTLPLSYGGLGPLEESRPRLSSNLRSAGFSTAGFQCNPFLSSHFNYEVGYDTYEDYQNPLMGIATKIFPRGIEINNPKLRKIDQIFKFTDIIKKTYHLVRGKPRPYVDAEVITDDTIDWLSKADSPFFCWSHYMDVHHPCYPPRPYRERYDAVDISSTTVSELYSSLLQDPEALDQRDIRTLERLYQAATEYVIEEINRILSHLKTTDKYRDTLVIFTSDHGELFGDHNAYGKPERMYDELLHVPLVIDNGPDYLADATEDLVSLVDVPPLCHDAVGIDVPEVYEGRIPGKDDPREVVLAEHEVEGEVIVGARSKNWLYEGDEITDEHRLFDLRDGGFDRVERNHPEGRIVREAVLARLEELDVDANYLQGEMDDEIEGRLGDLGYL